MARPLTKTYDVKCYELAQHFMHDQETATTAEYETKCNLLAIEIQEAIERFFDDVERD